MNENKLINARRTFYTTLYTLFRLLEIKDSSTLIILEKIKELGCNIDPKEILHNAYREIPNFLGRKIRKDLDPAARKLYPMTINEFYRNAGYEYLSAKPDHLTTMLAFMVQLIMDEEANALMKREDEKVKIRRIQHRFLNVHLIPLLVNYEENDIIKQLVKCIEKYVRNDLKLLHSLLTGDDKT